MPRKSYDVDAMASRIVELFDASSAAELAAGLDWYNRAEREAAALAAGTNLSTIQTAAVIAALSPRCQWAPNLAGAIKMVAAATNGAGQPIVAGTSANRAKAWRIANGEDPSAVLGGPKVRAFWANITGNVDEVTVDVWAARAAEGHIDPNGPTGGRYVAIADAYRAAAARRNVSPREMQAAVWVHIRGRAE